MSREKQVPSVRNKTTAMKIADIEAKLLKLEARLAQYIHNDKNLGHANISTLNSRIDVLTTETRRVMGGLAEKMDSLTCEPFFTRLKNRIKGCFSD